MGHAVISCVHYQCETVFYNTIFLYSGNLQWLLISEFLYFEIVQFYIHRAAVSFVSVCTLPPPMGYAGNVHRLYTCGLNGLQDSNSSTDGLDSTSAVEQS